MTLVHVFLSLAFAPKADLGWDPTITVSETTEGRVYHFDLEGRKFDTVAVLSDFAADAIIGRATRAFRVIDPVSKIEYALKDVWLDDDRELEHVIYDELLGDIEKKYGKDVREEAKKFLLTPEVHCKVKVDGQEDHTRKVMMRGREPSLNKTIHYRIVFKEVATPLYNVMDLRDIFVVLKDCTRLLQLMHGCGWVHRDISCGNVYYHDGHGRLGDLEYAKEKYSDGKHDVRTGTLDFMSVEVTQSKYLFQPELDFDVESESSSDEELIIPHLNFSYNDIHDMESMWWLPIWMMFFHDIKSKAITDELQRAKRILEIRELFPRNLNTGPRMTFLMNGFSFMESMSCLRVILKKKYQLFESTLPTLNQTVLDGLYDLIFKTWDLCIVKAKGVAKLVPVDFNPYGNNISPTTSTSKRKAMAAPPLSVVPAPKISRIGLPNA
ncbi:hypothetical protein EW145_g4588 [Phellinidium pouzarii]|uniref:Fungal-type protein kinase domain-containing protein n=1 Tax=Phellinidium pouzarii TaxID=167371 RepID=A0A4S4L351_9AGAM|nr:hypothetical protein EW145_g4588 [Phellinidium pouzarii]